VNKINKIVLDIDKVIRYLDGFKQFMIEGEKLTYQQMQVLSIIAKKERQYIGEVSKLLNTNPASTSITIEKLTIKQLVTRTYNRSDRRKVQVSLTDFGRQEYNRLEEKKIIILQDLQSSLTEKEIMLINSIFSEY
jgi:DNA-binding MarR family transcriptional regulator